MVNIHIHIFVFLLQIDNELHFQNYCGLENIRSTFKVSFDENIIDFDSRKVKERRAHDEVSTGKYRHPNFITSKSMDFLFYKKKMFPVGLTGLHATYYIFAVYFQDSKPKKFHRKEKFVI